MRVNRFFVELGQSIFANLIRLNLAVVAISWKSSFGIATSSAPRVDPGTRDSAPI